MNMNKIDLFKKLIKGEVKTIECFEPEFGVIERGTRFDFNEDSIIVTLWSSMNNIKESKEIVADRGLALCFFKQAIWSGKTAKIWKEGDEVIWEELVRD